MSFSVWQCCLDLCNVSTSEWLVEGESAAWRAVLTTATLNKPLPLQSLMAQMVRLKSELFALRMHAFHRIQEVLR